MAKCIHALLVAILGALVCPFGWDDLKSGLIVDRVENDSHAAKAGIHVGDRVVAYDGRALRSPQHLQAAEQNTVGKSSVDLKLEREGKDWLVAVPVGSLGMVVRPELSGSVVEHYSAAKSAAVDQRLDDLIRHASAGAEAAQSQGDRFVAAWLHSRIAEAYEARHMWKEAAQKHGDSLSLLDESDDRAARSLALTGLARCHFHLGDWDASIRWLEKAVHEDDAAEHLVWAADSLTRLGRLIANARRSPEIATPYFRRALAIREKTAPGSVAHADALHNVAAMLVMTAPKESEEYFRRALAVSEALDPNSIETAMHLIGITSLKLRQGDRDAARVLAERARQVIDQALVESDHLGHSAAPLLVELGNLMTQLGDSRLAADTLRQALTVVRSKGKSHETARLYARIGNLLSQLGDLDGAEQATRNAAELLQQFVPGSIEMADNLNNMGIVCWGRGDYKTARDYLSSAAAIYERVAPASYSAANTWSNLGMLSDGLGDSEAARIFLERALAAHEKLGSRSVGMAGTLVNLGNIALQRDEFDVADARYKQALEIVEKIAPFNPVIGSAARGLGLSARERGDLDSAQVHFERALQFRERVAPSSSETASSMSDLGLLALDRRDLPSARSYFERAKVILVHLAPESLSTALVINNLAEVAYHERQWAEAQKLYEHALAIVERQRGKMVAAESRALLLGQYISPYRGLLRTRLSLNDSSGALSVVERARARSLLDALSERKVDFTRDAPPELLEQQRQLDLQRTAAYRKLSQSNAQRDQANAEALRAELGGLDVRQRELENAIRLSSPRYAAIQYPETMHAAQMQASLDSGTLVLSYYVDEEQTYLFTTTRAGEERSAIRNHQQGVATAREAESAGQAEGIQVYRIPITARELGDSVQSMRRKLLAREEVKDEARALYELLIAPAQRDVNRAERLVICPDGALHQLPFAALMAAPEAGETRFLCDLKPLHAVVSLAVYAELRQPMKNHAGNRLRVLAFGDPDYRLLVPVADQTRGLTLQPTAKISPTKVSEPASLALPLGRLPGTRAELESIANVFGSSAQVFLGAAATKQAVINESISAHVVHFACHGLADDRDPLASGLALSPSGDDDDGILRAWEIFEKVRFDANLVVLSACQTGLGKTTQHEGVIGLTRALQYAGARSIVVSLWSVSDESTVELMKAFYKELKSGTPKDLSLQRAQATVRANPQWQHPFYWAPFVLVGDWRALPDHATFDD